MAFEDVLDRHNDHTVVIMPRLHKNKDYAVNGLYCRNCVKLIKWLSYRETKDLVNAGVDKLSMLPDEETELRKRKKKCKLISLSDLGL